MGRGGGREMLAMARAGDAPYHPYSPNQITGMKLSRLISTFCWRWWQLINPFNHERVTYPFLQTRRDYQFFYFRSLNLLGRMTPFSIPYYQFPFPCSSKWHLLPFLLPPACSCGISFPTTLLSGRRWHLFPYPCQCRVGASACAGTDASEIADLICVCVCDETGTNS